MCERDSDCCGGGVSVYFAIYECDSKLLGVHCTSELKNSLRKINELQQYSRQQKNDKNGQRINFNMSGAALSYPNNSFSKNSCVDFIVDWRVCVLLCFKFIFAHNFAVEHKNSIKMLFHSYSGCREKRVFVKYYINAVSAFSH